MAKMSSISPLSMKNSSPPRPRTLNRLRTRFSKENKSSPNLLGVKIKRFSEFENYSGRSRGTLGGFLPLPDMGSPDIDSLCLEKQKNVDKECVLTHLTKMIGLGIYTRGRDIAAEKTAERGYVDLDGDERETWYMFYPPPPSPSLALEPKEFDSASSPEPESDTSTLPSVPIVVSEVKFEPEGQPRLSTFTQGSQYATPNATSPVSPNHHHPIQRETKQDIDVDALILSAETLAEQYRGLLLTSDATCRPTSSHPHSENGISPLPVPSRLPSPLSFHPPSRPQTPKTLRKIRRQHSLRKLVDTNQLPLPSPTTPTILQPQMTTLGPFTNPSPITPLTPPLSATKPPPLTPPPALRSPDFLNTDVTPEPLHPTRLSLAAHPKRSPTPSHRHSRSNSDSTKPKAKMKRSKRDMEAAPEPPPRESSRSRGRSRQGGRKKSRPAGSRDDVEERAGSRPRRRGESNARQEGGKDRGRHRETRRHGVVDMVEVGGEGWL